MPKKIIRSYLSEINKIPDVLAPSHIPSLDGFRGLSILIVIIAHLNYSYKNPIVFFLVEGGSLGVYIFFVISGFIITTLLLKEKLRKGRISLRNFYIRRFLRIFPVAYLFLFVLCLLNYFFHLAIPAMAFAGAAFYLTNFSFIPFIWYTAHFWSLAVEEQYYLVFPFILKINFKIYCIIIPLLIVALNIIKMIAAWFPNNMSLQYVNQFFSKMDAVLVGSLFSILVFKELVPWALIKKYKIALNLLFVIVITLMHKTANHFHPWVINHTVSAVLIGVIILSNIIPADDFIYKLLNSRLLIQVGLLSYSIYIWQSIFTVPAQDPTSRNLHWNFFPVNMALLIIVSYCSYNFYEKKFLKLKGRFKEV